jgi:hypothetical protein
MQREDIPVAAQEDEAAHIKEQGRYAEKHRLAWETDIQEKQRLMRMLDDKEAFAAQVMERRAAEFAQLKVRGAARPDVGRCMVMSQHGRIMCTLCMFL